MSTTPAPVKAKEWEPRIDHNKIRLNHLVDTYGEPERQKDILVAEILSAFQIPEKWPLTDAERIQLLKRLYQSAKTIEETEHYKKATL